MVAQKPQNLFTMHHKELPGKRAEEVCSDASEMKSSKFLQAVLSVIINCCKVKIVSFALESYVESITKQSMACQNRGVSYFMTGKYTMKHDTATGLFIMQYSSYCI